MCILNATVEYICWPTKVPFIYFEHFYSLDFNGTMDFERKYYRVNPRLWFALRKICNPK